MTSHITSPFKMRRNSRDMQAVNVTANNNDGTGPDDASEQNHNKEVRTSSTKIPVTSVNDKLKWVIFPTDRWIRYWDLMMIFLLFFLLFIIPYQLGVSASYYLIENAGWMSLNLIFDFIFLVDTFLYFFRAYRDENGRLVFNLRKIRRRYVRSFFLWNLLGNFPTTLLIYSGWKDHTDDGVADNAVIVLKGIDLLKLCRFVRISYLSSSSEAINEYKQNRKSQARLQLFRFAFALVALSHCFACFWSFLAFVQAGTFSEGLLENDNWIAFWYNNTYEEGTINPVGWTQDRDRYILSLFWSIQSITSIGYGNIVPFTPLEWWFSCVMMLLAGVLWAFIIGALVGVASALELHNDLQRLRVDQANEMIRHFSKEKSTENDENDVHDIDNKSLEKRVKSYIQYQKMYSNNLASVSTFSQAFPVVDTLSPELQRLSSFMVLKDYLELVPYLSSRFLSVEERSIVAKKCMRLEFAAGETIHVHEGVNNIGRGIFILANGSAFAIHGTYADFSERRKKSFVLTAGDLFGHFHVLLEDGAPGSEGGLQFIVFTRVIFIPRHAVIEALRKNPKAWKDNARWAYLAVALLSSTTTRKKDTPLEQNEEYTCEETNGGDDNSSALSVNPSTDKGKKTV